MAHADSTVTISRPIGEVFAYLADGTNNPHWRAGVLEIERISPADSDQAVYRQVLRGPGGRRIDGDYRITEYHPPRVIGFEVTAGPLREGRDADQGCFLHQRRDHAGRPPAGARAPGAASGGGLHWPAVCRKRTSHRLVRGKDRGGRLCHP